MLMEFTTFAGDAYLSLTSFGDGGEPVTKPVWFAQIEGKLYLMCDAAEVQRIHHNAQVEVAPCTKRGEARGAPLEAMALVLPGDQSAVARRALHAKYGLRQRLREFERTLHGAARVYLEVTPM